ncbi:MAG TPA: AAA family ATPase, partial [Lamprocystis sp. (in: g-proteobacteria)]|nr:AAA family ATPase [Lamprocystis sp. (in: g-proteobacteria)]
LQEGWRIFPVDQEKKPGNANGALGPYIESESDARRFWANGGKFGIAAATGQGLLVLDVDLPAGPESIVRLESELGSLPPTRTSRTPTGGAQLLFRVPASFSPRNTQGALAPGIDVRCQSGYVVLPPSRGHYQKDIGNGPILIDGRWQWAFTDDFAELPAAWRDRVAEVSRAPREGDRPPAPSQAAGRTSPSIDAWLAGAREPGKWHTNVLALTAHLVAKGRTDREILAFAHELTCPGYTLDQTRDELRVFIQGARDKGFAPPGADAGGVAGRTEGSTGITAADLLAMPFPPIRYVVEGYVVEGLTILGGRPKLGKSWMALDFAVAVATGGHALGSIPCEQGDVLFLALEDNRRRLQSRLMETLDPVGGHQPAGLERLTFHTQAGRLDGDLMERLEAWRTRVPDARLVIIDVLAKVRPQRGRGEGVYDYDYRSVELLQQWAITHSVAVLLVHHVRKAEAEDPLEMLSGSNGLTGAADTILVLARNAHGLTLYGRGRDIEEIETAIDRDGGTWRILGGAEEVWKSDERRVILNVLREAGEPMRPADID